MRHTLGSLCLILGLGACASTGVPYQTIAACRSGDATACQERSLHEQAELDANAILMGMQTSSARRILLQGRTP